MTHAATRKYPVLRSPLPSNACVYLSSGVRVMNARITSALLQLVSNPLVFCLGHRHMIDESSNVAGKIVVTVFREEAGNGTPTVLYLAPRFYKGALTGFDARVALQEFSRDRLGLCTEVGGIAAQASAIDAVLLRLSRFTTHCAFGCVGLNAEQSQVSGELRPPVTKRRLLDVQSYALFTYGLEH